MQRESAEDIASDALIWLAGEDSLLRVFMGATGADAETIRQGASDPAFLGAVLDFLLLDDAWIMAFAAATNTPPARLAEARRALPGGPEIHWT